jgi:hypothetical protein
MMQIIEDIVPRVPSVLSRVEPRHHRGLHRRDQQPNRPDRLSGLEFSLCMKGSSAMTTTEKTSGPDDIGCRGN